MPGPFPGMDPWLERPALWPGVHVNLIISLQRALAPLIAPRYYVEVGQRAIFSVFPPAPQFIYPDVSVFEDRQSHQPLQAETAVLAEPIIVALPNREKVYEDYLKIVETATHRVITVIAILSWSNKQPGRDRKAYEAKRRRIFQTETNLVEIDLLRAGQPMPFVFSQPNGHLTHYRVLIKRGDNEWQAYLYPFSIQDAIPIFPLPLQPGDSEPAVRLGEILNETYDVLRYASRLDYNQTPEPRLSDAEAQWAAEILRAKR